MSEIAVRPQPDTQTVSIVRQAARDFAAAAEIATAISKTSFAPAHFRGKPEECTIAILYGATLNFDPFTAVQQLYVIGGKPALYARAMVSIVLSKGHEIWTEEESPGRCVVAGRRKGTEKVERVEWTTELARQAGYTTNKKYQTDPRAMLYARASGDVARRIAPDALMGIAYNVEELELGEIPVTVHTAGAPAPTGGVTAAEIMGEIEAAPSPAATPPSDGEPGPITAEQFEALMGALAAAGLDDRDEALATLRDITSRDIRGPRDLNTVEASTVIDTLTALTKRQATPDPDEPPADLLAEDPWAVTTGGAA